MRILKTNYSMKRFSLLVFLLSLIAFTGCDVLEDDRIVDWAPVNLYLKVTDGKGTDLLDPESPNNMIDGTTITFKGKTYEASREWMNEQDSVNEPKTRAYLAHMYGLLLINDSMYHKDRPQGFSLVFGEIDGAADMDEDLVVTLPDGTTGTIHYHCSDHSERKLKCNRSWKFNGAKADSNVFTFIVSK